MDEAFSRTWAHLSQEVITGMHEWRLAHPTATLNEIEAAIDERLGRLRAQMLQDAALASAACEGALAEEAVACPSCGGAAQPTRQRPKRQLQSAGGAPIELTRRRWQCLTCGVGFFPLDEELALVPGQLTPRLHEHLVRLSIWIPSFARAAELLAALTGATVEASTARRQTEAAGAAALAVEEAELARVQQTGDVAPDPGVTLCYQVDGVMVPLVGGQWAEVKQLAVGEVQPALLNKEGEWVVPTRHWSYFARLAEADPFTEQATVELARRGVLTAHRVAAVNDGAEWIEGFHAYHRPDVPRILDFPHAAQRVAALVEGLAPVPADTLSKWCQLLKTQGAECLLAKVRSHLTAHPAADTLLEHVRYLEKRGAQMDYPTFRSEGWPIASGAIESGNKLVVEARLKGSGMHWSRAHVNPLLALRTLACSDRWVEQWPLITAQLRQQACNNRRLQRVQRQAARTPPSPVPAPPLEPLVPPPPPTPLPEPSERQPHRPAPDHPWRRQPIGKVRFQTPLPRSA